jgi:hypothetical protein
MDLARLLKGNGTRGYFCPAGTHGRFEDATTKEEEIGILMTMSRDYRTTGIPRLRQRYALDNHLPPYSTEIVAVGSDCPNIKCAHRSSSTPVPYHISNRVNRLLQEIRRGFLFCSRLEPLTKRGLDNAV